MEIFPKKAIPPNVIIPSTSQAIPFFGKKSLLRTISSFGPVGEH